MNSFIKNLATCLMMKTMTNISIEIKKSNKYSNEWTLYKKILYRTNLQIDLNPALTKGHQITLHCRLEMSLKYWTALIKWNLCL